MWYAGMAEEYPRNLAELEANFGTEEPRISGPDPVARRFPLSTLRWRPVMARPRSSAGMCGLWLPNFGDRRHVLPGHANPFTGLVPRHVVANHPKERRERLRAATGAWAEELRDSLGLAA